MLLLAVLEELDYKFVVVVLVVVPPLLPETYPLLIDMFPFPGAMDGPA
jgi:hypothetical protein